MVFEKLRSTNAFAISGQSMSLVILVLFLFAGVAWCTGSPFEIEIHELEQATKTEKREEAPVRQPDRKRSGRTAVSPAAGAPVIREGNYIRYTIRPGDHIYKILTTRFGLSSARAEELTPLIKQINNITDTSRLQIGQVILIPLPPGTAAPARRNAPAPAVTAPQPAPPQPPPVPQPAAVDQGLWARAQELWTALFPERATATLQVAAGENRLERLLEGADGRKITIVPPGTAPVFASYSGMPAEQTSTLVADPGNEKDFVTQLLKAGGFDTFQENVPLSFGTDPKVSLQADALLGKRIPGTDVRENILVMLRDTGSLPAPPSLSAFLSNKGFRLVEWFASPGHHAATPGITVNAVPTDRGPEAIVDALLNALAVTWSSDHPIDVVVGENGGSSLSINVDRYVVSGGKRFVLDFGGGNPNHATLMRLLELAGYRKLSIKADDDFRSISGKLLDALDMKAEYRKYVFRLPADDRYEVELSGMLIHLPGPGEKTTFVTNLPLEQALLDALSNGQWAVK